MTKLLQTKYKEFKLISAEMDRIDEAFGEDLMNDELEAEFDNYYTNVYFPKHEELVQMIANIANCDMKTSRALLASEKFEALMGLTIC